MDYISIDDIISRVKTRLYSLDEASLIDEVMLISWSKWMIDRLGMSLSIEKEEIIEVENYQCNLPEDFHLLWVVHKCEQCEENKGSKVKYYLNSNPYFLSIHLFGVMNPKIPFSFRICIERL